MVRVATVSSALLVAASALSVCNAHLQYKIRVKNLTNGQPFSPMLLFSHTPEISAFHLGVDVDPEFRKLAEEGDFSELLAFQYADDVAPFLCGFTTGSEILAPGGEEWFTLEVDDTICPDGAVFSLVSMMGHTNDGFVGIDSMRLETSQSSTVYPPALDAGTEYNNELCSHMPGLDCGAKSGNKQDAPGEGFVSVHRGIHGVGDLSAADYDWRNPVAEVYISKPTSAHD